MLIDSHCHLTHIEGLSVEELVENALANKVTQMLNICVDRSDFKPNLKVSQTHQAVRSTIGMHPCDIDVHDESIWDDMRALIEKHPDVFIGIGETGLDYYHSQELKKEQQAFFCNHIDLATDYDLPLVVHSRSAPDDTVGIIKEKSPKKAIIHCFTESKKMAEQCLDLGCYISFSGIITFKNAAELREVVDIVPLERMLIETDSPYLAPVPYRGKTNQPAYVSEVARKVAEIKGISFESVANQTTQNFKSLFNWSL